ncbi:MAG: N-acetylmuramoyl-L-alanine amidase, partial [Sumerlaeia bacterium]
MKTTSIIQSGLMALAFAATLPSLSNAQTKIYIDPGHGGSDPGAVNSTFGTQEAARVLYTGLELRNYLNADSANTSGGGNWTTRMSRTTNVSVSLSARSVDSNNWGSARFLSI